MKTQILRLETHDTVTSICDKLAWAQSPRILLAFPREKRRDIRDLFHHSVQSRLHSKLLGRLDRRKAIGKPALN